MILLYYLLPLVTSSQLGNNGPYPCTAGVGSIYALVAIVLYIITSIVFCVSPKPEPCVRRMKEKKEKEDPCACCRKKKMETDEVQAPPMQAPPAQAPPVQAPPPQAPPPQAPPPQAPPIVQEDPDAALRAVAAGAGAAAVANRTYELEHPPTQVVYAYDDYSEGQSSAGAVTLPFYMSADVVEGDLYFDANTVA